MKFNIEYSSGAVKFLRKAGAKKAERIIKKIDEIAQKPLLLKAKKVVGSDSVFRVRVGDYRILYEVDFKTTTIGIVKIDRRDKVYRK
ncbi:type II toxin-antitoxin system RelE/ParE family toxin [bacterium]|nr:type II toxin-antitoxin system RelE/ParE family toxin [bacterium]